MGSRRVVPIKKEFQLPLQVIAAKRNDLSARAAILHRQDKTLDDGDAAVLANSSESWRDLMMSAPRVITFVFPKLTAFVGDQIPGR